MSEFLGWYDILHGVGELIVDESKLVLHAIFDQMRHEVPSDHFKQALEDQERRG